MEKSKADVTGVPEIPPRILHDQHCPEICAMQVNLVYQRNRFLSEQNLKNLEDLCNVIQEKGKLKVQAQRATLEHKLMLAKHSSLQKALLEAQGKQKHAEDKLVQAQESRRKSSLAVDDLQVDLEFARAAQADLQKKNVDLVQKIEELRQKLQKAREIGEKQMDNGAKCMQEAKAYVARKEKEVDDRIAELDHEAQWLREKKAEIEKQSEDFEHWAREKATYESEIGRLRELNRRQRFSMSHPNNKAETNDLKIQLNNYIAREEDMHRQLHNLNLLNIDLQKQLKDHSIRQHKRMTFLNQTQSSSSKK